MFTYVKDGSRIRPLRLLPMPLTAGGVRDVCEGWGRISALIRLLRGSESATYRVTYRLRGSIGSPHRARAAYRFTSSMVRLGNGMSVGDFVEMFPGQCRRAILPVNIDSSLSVPRQFGASFLFSWILLVGY